MEIIDSHAHYDSRMLELPALVRKMDEHGIAKVALIPCMNDPLPHTPERLLSALRHVMARRLTRPLAELVHRALLTPEGDLRLDGRVYQIYQRPDNQAVAKALRAYPQRLLGWIFLNPRNNPKVLDELEEYRAVPGMIGVKLHPHWHDYRTELLNPIMRRLAELKLPALIHLGFGRRGDFRALATSYPQVPLICAHAGFPFYRDLWVHGRALPNLYVDLSSPYIDEALARAAVATLGPERCLYGTDAPYGFPEKDLTSGGSGPYQDQVQDHGAPKSYDYGEIKGWIERLPIPSAARAAIFADNLRALLTPAAVNL